MNMSPSNETRLTLKQKQLELELKREKLVEGIILRSRAKWLESGEKCSKYFCQLEKRNYIKKTISDLIIHDKHVTNQSDINSEVACYYKTLYSRNVLNIDERFFEHRIKLTDEQRELCEGNLTFNECTESLKSMKNGKSPGSDGYTVDFYKKFWKDIGPFLFRSYNMYSKRRKR